MSESRQDGYTLAEALAALLIVGLAIGGMIEGARVIGRLQAPVTKAVGETRQIRQAEAALEALLAARPVGDRSLKGDRGSMSFDCGGVCGLEIRPDRGRSTLVVRDRATTRRYVLPFSSVNLLYDTRNGRYDQWPPTTQDTALRGVVVVATAAEGEVALLAAHSWIEQPKICAFDMVSKTCRTTTP